MTDLNKFFDENKVGALQDFTWLDSGETFDASQMHSPNNMKPELELEWGLGAGEHTDLEDRPVTTMQDEMNVQSENKVLVYSRKLMLSGVMGQDLVSQISKKFHVSEIKKSANKLKELFSKDGIIGTMAYDTEDYSVCRDIKKDVKASPYKDKIKYVFMKQACVECKFLSKVEDSMSGVGGNISGDNLTGSLFGEIKAERAFKPFCSSLGLPILSGQQDLDDSEMDGTLIDLVTLGDINEEQAEEIKSSDMTAYEKVKKAFILSYKNKQKDFSAYSKKVDNSEYTLEASDMEVNLDMMESPSEKNSKDANVCFVEASELDIEFGGGTEGDIEINAQEEDVYKKAISKHLVPDRKISNATDDNSEFIIDAQEFEVDLDGEKQSVIEINDMGIGSQSGFEL